jgi:hypothetical protein
MHQDDQGQVSSRSKIVLRSEGRAVVAIVVSTGRGHNASYPFKTTGAAEGSVITGQCGAGNYLSAVQKGREPAGTRRFGLEWAYQPASKGRVITGFPESAMDRFSSRAQITKTALALADQYGKDRGRAPDERALPSMPRFANAMTCRAKEPGALNFAALLRGWEPASRVAELGTLRGPARTMWHAAPRASAPSGARDDARAELAQTAARLAPRGELTRADFGQLQTQLHAGGWRLDGRSG